MNVYRYLRDPGSYKPLFPCVQYMGLYTHTFVKITTYIRMVQWMASALFASACLHIWAYWLTTPHWWGRWWRYSPPACMCCYMRTPHHSQHLEYLRRKGIWNCHLQVLLALGTGFLQLQWRTTVFSIPMVHLQYIHIIHTYIRTHWQHTNECYQYKKTLLMPCWDWYLDFWRACKLCCVLWP